MHPFTDVFETVLEVFEYHDGPRAGIAMYRGVSHTFLSRMLNAFEYNEEFESVDIFELKPTSTLLAQPPMLANAVFRVIGESPVDALGGLRAMEVLWQVISEPSA